MTEPRILIHQRSRALKLFLAITTMWRRSVTHSGISKEGCFVTIFVRMKNGRKGEVTHHSIYSFKYRKYWINFRSFSSYTPTHTTPDNNPRGNNFTNAFSNYRNGIIDVRWIISKFSHPCPMRIILGGVYSWTNHKNRNSLPPRTLLSIYFD